MKTILFLVCLSLALDFGRSQSCDIIMELPGGTTEFYSTEFYSTEFYSSTEFDDSLLGPATRKLEQTPRNIEFSVSETVSTDTPIVTGSAINVAFALLKSTFFRLVISGEEVELYATPALVDYLDTTRTYYYIETSIDLRCKDGTTKSAYIFAFIMDENTKSPKFSIETFDLSVLTSWPIDIPINTYFPLFVRDEDYTLGNAEVTVTSSSSTVSVKLTPLVTGGENGLAVPFDYRVELFLRENTLPGNYLIELLASDGVHSSSSTLNLTVTEIVCKGQRKEPIFGNRADVKARTYYNATLNRLPLVGDFLAGVNVEAYDPDELCNVDLSVNSEYLSVGEDGGIVFVKPLTVEELMFGRTWIVDLEATGKESGISQTIPLIISLDFNGPQ